ncbi:YecR family lipoprotein [Methyloligella sp. 2.7D]|uniref:YecR family lipoprotein n=1 Tax=unclassified Methyloligella TaxID=2625955 RepID=UPI001ABB5DEC|nr:YecR family lipoprotein [Methyloligella sp. GL2]
MLRVYVFTIAMMAAAVGLAGCSAQKELVATGGSRADGTIDLSYEYGAFEKPVFSEAQGIATAQERCKAWGYSSAEPFGGQKRECQETSQYGCVRYFVTMTYQCLGKGNT